MTLKELLTKLQEMDDVAPAGEEVKVMGRFGGEDKAIVFEIKHVASGYSTVREQNRTSYVQVPTVFLQDRDHDE